MRNLIYIALISLIFCASCTRNSETDRQIADLEELMEVYPDSAMRLIDSIRAKGLSTRKYRMRFLLLKAQATHACYMRMDTLNQMPLITDYYSSNGSTRERILAKYMTGCHLRDKGNSPEALEIFRNAIRMADTTNNKCDFRLLSRIYGQMAVLFHNQRIPKMEIKSLLTAYSLAMRAKDTLKAIMFYDHISCGYYAQKKYDKALEYSQRSQQMFINTGHKGYAVSSLIMDAAIYLNLRKTELANKALCNYERLVKEIGTGTSYDNYENFLLYKGRYYVQANRPDSAIACFYGYLSRISDITLLEPAYEGLMNAYQQKHQYDSIIKYSTLFTQANDTSNTIESGIELSRALSLYNYNEAKDEAYEKTQQIHAYKRSIAIAILILFVIIAVITHIILNNRRRQREKLAAINLEYSQTMQKYAELMAERAEMENDFEHYKQEQEQKLNAIRQKLSKDNAVLSESWDVEQVLLSADIVVRLHKLAAKAKRASENELNELRETVMTLLPNFHSFITNDNDLTEQELYVCLLTRAHFIPSEIQVLLLISKQRLSNIKSCLNKRLFASNGARGLDSALRKLQ